MSSNTVGFTARSASRIPDDSNWKTPVESARASISYVLRSSSGIVPISSPLPISSTALSITSRLRSPRKSTLSKPERLDVLHRDLRHDLGVGALLLQRDDLDQRLGADDDSGRVDRVGSREPLERPGEVDDLLGNRIGVDDLAQLGAVRHRVLERLPRPFGNELRDAVDDAVRDLEDATGIADRRPRGHRRERDDLRDAVAAVLLGDVVDDPLPAFDREVDVHVGHVLAGGVEEALEQQPVAQRLDVRDPEAVGDERACRRAAPGADRDAVVLREADEVGDDEEVVGEAHLVDRLELEPQPILELGRRGAVAACAAPPRRARRGSRTRRGRPAPGTSAAGCGRARSRRCTARRPRASGASRPRGRRSRAPSRPGS